MRRLFILVLTAILSLSLCACGAPKPEDTINSFNAALKNFDTVKMQEYIMNPNNELNAGLGESTEFGAQFESKLREWAKEINGTVVSSSADGDKATVVVKYSYDDSKKIMEEFLSEYMQVAFGMAFNGASQEEMDKVTEGILSDKLANVAVGKTERTITYNLTKVNKEWKINEIPDDLLYVMTADITVVLEEFANALNNVG